MIETVISMELPVGEKFTIRKNRLQYQKYNKHMKRMSIISGIHGDEIEGQYICYEVARRIKEKPECFTGIIDIYPAFNPIGIDMAHRRIPNLDLDMTRMFPGDSSGDML